MTHTKSGTRTAPWPRALAVGLTLTAALACASADRSGMETSPPSATASDPAPLGVSASEVRAARADSLREAYVEADVEFMRGMIHHHAQALVMSRMAPTHGASERLQVLAARIINAQKDEITLMRDWLLDNEEPAPEVAPDGTMVGRAAHSMHHMPGMLTDAQMSALEGARGADFDRMYLIYMIQHHQGALTMVDELLGAQGAAQNAAVFKLASDIAADQASEIERMQTMLRAMMFETEGPS